MSKPPSRFRFHRWAPAAGALTALALAVAACGRPQNVAASPAMAGACAEGPTQAAQRNLAGMRSMAFAPFRRAETGWQVYAPLAAHEIGTRCDGASPAFARRLSAWQATHGLQASGVLDPATFLVMKAIWQARRPFVAASHRACPPPPPETSLARVPADESFGGKILLLRPAALAAYGRMLAAARAEVPQTRADGRFMTLFSAYRSPAYDDARCAREGNCQGVVRARCSAHRTGLAIDLYLGAAPGFAPDSSDDANRLAISRGATYRWMVTNAARFGFVNYPFEPWHWEWTGEAI